MGRPIPVNAHRHERNRLDTSKGRLVERPPGGAIADKSHLQLLVSRAQDNESIPMLQKHATLFEDIFTNLQTR